MNTLQMKNFVTTRNLRVTLLGIILLKLGIKLLYKGGLNWTSGVKSVYTDSLFGVWFKNAF